MRARVISIFVVVALLIPITSAHSLGSVWPAVPSIGFSSSDNSLVETKSYVTGLSFPAGATTGLYSERVTCNSVDDLACSQVNSIFAQAILPPCSTPQDEMCVESLEVTDASGVLHKATLGYEAPGERIPASKARKVPAGGSASVWHAKDSLNSAGLDEYAVSVSTTFQNYQNKGCTQYVTAPCGFTSGFRARVFPIAHGAITGSSETCLWTEAQDCIRAADFSAGARVALTLRIDNSLTGFLFGRMKNVNLDVKPLSTSANLLRVEANPIDVPKIYAYVAKSDLSKYPKIIDYWKERRQQLAADDFTSPNTIDTGPAPEWAMSDFLAFEDLVKSAELVTSIWRFGTQSGTGSGSPCYADKSKLQGLVTTNAPTYFPNPPTFVNGELIYKVAGAHYLQDGVTLFKGSYDLVLRTDFARCLYGFTKAPVQAKVSVVSTDGSVQDIASEIIREDDAHEWLYLSAKNFTFSSPTIKVKLSQVGAPAAAEKVPAAPAKKTTTITCVKGKLTKKVTAVKATCPTGYKKK